MADLTGLKNAYGHVYPYFPVTVQNAAWSAIGWHNEITCRGRGFASLLKEYEARERASIEEITHFRDARLRAFLLHAYGTVPYYKRLFDEIGFHPHDLTGLEDLAALPVLRKTTLREHQSELVSTAVSRRRHKLIATGGSTGSRLVLATTIEAVQEQWAVAWRYFHWHGIERGTWVAMLGSPVPVPLQQNKPPFWRFDFAGHRIIFSSVHTSARNLDHYLSELRKRRPLWFHGLPSQLTLLAAHLVDRKTDLGYRVRWITTSSENLLPQQSDLIEHAFGTRPIQHYASVEAVANASECENGKLHVDEEFSGVEFIPIADNRFLVVGTNLSNPVTPLIRYDCNDHVTIEPGDSCSCGRPGRIVTTVDGRQDDYVVMMDGTRLGRLERIFYGLPRVREAQIRQSKIGEITILVRTLSEYTKDDDLRLREEARKWICDGSQISIEYVDEIERTASGKLRFVVSTLDSDPSARYEVLPQVALAEATGSRAPAEMRSGDRDRRR
jgi:phenylacetate-CoA ligase